MPLWVAILNSAAALASAGFGVAALIRPALIAPPRDGAQQSRFYPAMYAGRAIPFGIAVIAVIWFAPSEQLTIVIVGIAALMQLVDVAIGGVYRLNRMMGGALLGAACHVLAIVVLL